MTSGQHTLQIVGALGGGEVSEPANLDQDQKIKIAKNMINPRSIYKLKKSIPEQNSLAIFDAHTCQICETILLQNLNLMPSS